MNSAQFSWVIYLFQAGFFKQSGALVVWQTILQSLATPSVASSPAAQSSLFTPFFAYESGSTYPTSYALQGITGGNSSGDYIITGTKNLANGGNPAAQGLVYQGPINAANTSQGNGNGTYKLPATISPGPNGSLGAAATATITRDSLTGGFSNASWEILPLNYPSTGAVPVFTTNDSIFDKASVGAYTLSQGNFSDYAFLNAT